MAETEATAEPDIIKIIIHRGEFYAQVHGGWWKVWDEDGEECCQYPAELSREEVEIRAKERLRGFYEGFDHGKRCGRASMAFDLKRLLAEGEG